MRRMPLLVAAIASAGAFCALADRGAGDWVVLHDGTRLETRGPWEVRGAQVVLTLPNGTFSSLRTEAVDLEASRQATEESKLPAREPEPVPRREPILVVTDRDLARTALRPLADSEEATTGGGASPTTASVSPPSLEVVDWSSSYSEEQDGAVLMGALRNNGSTLAFSVQVTVSILDDAGEVIALAPARLARPGVPPGAIVSFVAVVPGVVFVNRAEFEIISRSVTMQPLSPATAAARDPEEPRP